MSTLKAGNIQPQSDSDPLVLSTNAAERMRISNTGEVGIGTTSLSGIGKLVVEQSGGNRGIIVQNGTNPHMITTDGTVISKLQTMTGVRGHVGCESNHSFSIITNNTEKLTVTNSGLVGIGTNSPTSTLQVVGGVSVSGGITAGSFSAGNIAPLPTSSSGVGQFIALNPALSAAAVLPSGGTWAYFIVLMIGTGSSNYQGSVEAGVAAGGTTVGAANASYRWNGFCWRIT